jgi:type II secretory pathway predicted ATPase ExeA
MLNAYWGLSGNVFDKSIKADQLYQSNGLKELNSRLDHMKMHRGIMLITGQPGTGKTTSLRAFVNSLPELSFKTFYVPLSTVNVLDFYKQLNFKLSGQSLHSKSQLFESIQKNIVELARQRKKLPVIILDEAHLLKNENFMELQLLMNFNMDSTDPALVIIAGQRHLYDRLSMPMMKSFFQRIIIKAVMPPLDKDETEPFIEHHLKLKGCPQFPFTKTAVEAIYKTSNGVPRQIAALCAKTMTLGMFEKITELTEEHVFQASQEL